MTVIFYSNENRPYTSMSILCDEGLEGLDKLAALHTPYMAMKVFNDFPFSDEPQDNKVRIFVRGSGRRGLQKLRTQNESESCQIFLMGAKTFLRVQNDL